MDKLLIGWKEIGWEWGLRGVTIQTVRSWARAMNMPLIYIRGKPTIEKSKLHLWWKKILDKSVVDLPLLRKYPTLIPPGHTL